MSFSQCETTASLNFHTHCVLVGIMIRSKEYEVTNFRRVSMVVQSLYEYERNAFFEKVRFEQCTLTKGLTIYQLFLAKLRVS